MKKFLLPLLLSFACLTGVTAQSSTTGAKAPAQASQLLKTKFPSASRVNWKQEKNLFVAEFSNGGTATSAFFDGQGNLVETHAAIAAKKIPAPVQNTVGAEFKGLTTSSHALIETASKETFYKVVVDRGTEWVELRVNPQGYITNTIRTEK
jgi:hypothetical protein